jgi:hypothetical protein
MVTLKEDIHVGDTPVIRFTVKDAGVIVDLTSATVLRVNILKSDETTVMTRILSVEDAINGIVYYGFSDGEVDMAGFWKAQPYIEMAGWKGYADKVEFYVKPVLPTGEIPN